jgi:iron complex transport system ATP-binding protein
LIEIKNSTFGYSFPILEANLTLKKGNVYALVGKNGSGKTTFLQSLAGNIPLLSGEIEIEGKNLKVLSLKEKSVRIAFIETRFPQINFMTAFEFVSLGRFPHTGALGRLNSNDTEKIEQSFTLLQIEKLKNKFISEISDGEKQLLQVAKAIVQETDVILLDEPMAFLDYSNKRILVEKLVQISSELNKCVLLSSHDIEICLDYKLPFLVVSIQKKQIDLLQSATKEILIKQLEY